MWEVKAGYIKLVNYRSSFVMNILILSLEKQDIV